MSSEVRERRYLVQIYVGSAFWKETNYPDLRAVQVGVVDTLARVPAEAGSEAWVSITELRPNESGGMNPVTEEAHTWRYLKKDNGEWAVGAFVDPALGAVLPGLVHVEVFLCTFKGGGLQRGSVILNEKNVLDRKFALAFARKALNTRVVGFESQAIVRIWPTDTGSFPLPTRSYSVEEARFMCESGAQEWRRVLSFPSEEVVGRSFYSANCPSSGPYKIQCVMWPLRPPDESIVEYRYLYSVYSAGPHFMYLDNFEAAVLRGDIIEVVKEVRPEEAQPPAEGPGKPSGGQEP